MLEEVQILAFGSGRDPSRFRPVGVLNLVAAVGTGTAFSVIMAIVSLIVPVIAGAKEIIATAIVIFSVFTPLGATILGGLGFVNLAFGIVLLVKGSNAAAPQPETAMR